MSTMDFSAAHWPDEIHNFLILLTLNLRIEQGCLGVKCYALFNELSIYCCKEDICLLYIHKSHFKDQSNDVFIFIMSKLRSV